MTTQLRHVGLLFAATISLIACHTGESSGPEPLTPTFTKLSAGLGFTCALDSEGTAYCWGRSDRGQLGNASTSDEPVPVKVATDVKFTTITSGNNHSCALTPNGAAYCWGDNSFQKIGSGTATVELPREVQGGLRFTSIAASLQSTCATTSELDVYCWGRLAATNQFGDNLAYPGTQPLKVGAGMVAVVGGTDGGYCSVDNAALAYCWDLVFTYPPAGAVIPPIGQPVSGSLHFATLRRGYGHFCGVLNSGQTDCWGTNAAAQVGIGNTTATVPVPTPVSSSVAFGAVAAGGTDGASGFSCGLAAGGKIYCWGANITGQLGTGSFASATTPTAVAGNHLFTSVRAGGLHTCAIATDGDTYCWGNNTNGELGNGTTVNSAVPKQVSWK